MALWGWWVTETLDVTTFLKTVINADRELPRRVRYDKIAKVQKIATDCEEVKRRRQNLKK